MFNLNYLIFNFKSNKSFLMASTSHWILKIFKRILFRLLAVAQIRMAIITSIMLVKFLLNHVHDALAKARGVGLFSLISLSYSFLKKCQVGKTNQERSSKMSQIAIANNTYGQLSFIGGYLDTFLS